MMSVQRRWQTLAVGTGSGVWIVAKEIGSGFGTEVGSGEDRGVECGAVGAAVDNINGEATIIVAFGSVKVMVVVSDTDDKMALDVGAVITLIKSYTMQSSHRKCGLGQIKTSN